jgi:hypothetical protein
MCVLHALHFETEGYYKICGKVKMSDFSFFKFMHTHVMPGNIPENDILKILSVLPSHSSECFM